MFSLLNKTCPRTHQAKFSALPFNSWLENFTPGSATLRDATGCGDHRGVGRRDLGDEVLWESKQQVYQLPELSVSQLHAFEQ